jgi:hypothetical protein
MVPTLQKTGDQLVHWQQGYHTPEKMEISWFIGSTVPIPLKNGDQAVYWQHGSHTAEDLRSVGSLAVGSHIPEDWRPVGSLDAKFPHP